LRALGAYDWADVIVVDDGSTDGTREAIEAEFPDVIVLAGDGNLWWAGGINVGMKSCYKSGYGFFFWLNDDCRPHPQTLEKMLLFSQRNHGVCTAVSVTPSGYSYGGFKKTAWGLKRVNSGECDTFGGNCVCFPASVIDRVGYLDAVHFPMDPADADYGLRVKKAGYPVVALEGAICENNDNLSAGKKSWLFSDVPLKSYLNNFFKNRHHISYIPTYFRFRVRHWGVEGLLNALWFYLRFFIYSSIRLVAPKKFLLRISNRSAAWRKEAHYLSGETH
jgi:GT2 family glycosyltransferase